MKVQQTAGDVGIEVYTDGSPLWPELTVEQINGDRMTIRLCMADLYDLRYCIERVLAQLGTRSS